MPEMPRLWTDEEVVLMGKTVDVLRKIRTAATQEPSHVLSFVKRGVAAALGNPYWEIRPEMALKDAEQLGDVASRAMALRIAERRDKGEGIQDWQEALQDMVEYYLDYSSSTFAQSTLTNVVGAAFISRLRALNVDPDCLLRYELVDNNNLGVTKVSELSDDRRVVIAPLSGDFLLASTYRHFLKIRNGKTFHLRPAALSKDLTHSTLPLETDDPKLAQAQEVGIYIDTIATGSTGRALHEAVQKKYPEKKVQMPNHTGKDFVQSPKLEAFWRKYGKK